MIGFLLIAVWLLVAARVTPVVAAWLKETMHDEKFDPVGWLVAAYIALGWPVVAPFAAYVSIVRAWFVYERCRKKDHS